MHFLTSFQNCSMRVIRCKNGKLVQQLSTCTSNLQKHIYEKILIDGKEFEKDLMTNVTPNILSKIGKQLHLLESHPLGLLHRRIVQFMYKRYRTPRGNPLFSIYDQLCPVVTTKQNFDSLLVPKNHVSRQKGDNYYINKDYLLRAHTTAHQADLIKMGLDNFMMVGDVYRRDEIDSSHYPVFHQADAVKLFSKNDIFGHLQEDISEKSIFEERTETDEHQCCHSDEALKVIKADLLDCLESLALSLFGKDVELRWVSAYFPFTHPSWELELKIDDEWMEILGCGIIRQNILQNSGAPDKVGWAFGLGLERWAMKLYEIPDIRIFWSTDQRFLEQFNVDDPNASISFKAFSNQPPCMKDVSFWLPPNSEFSSEDFYDFARTVGEDLIEKIELIDSFTHPKTGLLSHCYRITYRSWERPLLNAEVNELHNQLSNELRTKYNVTLR